MATAYTISYNRYQTVKLSEREIEVLYLIAYGFRNKEISQMLYLSIHTVDTYRKNLLFKMQAKNTAGLVRRAYEENIFPMELPEFLHGIPKDLFIEKMNS